MTATLMDYTTPAGATISVRRGYIEDQFVRNVYSLVIEFRDALGHIMRATMWEMDNEKRRPPRLIAQLGAGTRRCDLGWLTHNGGRVPSKQGTWRTR